MESQEPSPVSRVRPMRFRVQAGAATHIGRRAANADAVLVDEAAGLYAVADGRGDGPASSRAGNSRVHLLRASKGRLAQLGEDHTVAGRHACGGMDPAGAAQLPDADKLTQVVGARRGMDLQPLVRRWDSSNMLPSARMVCSIASIRTSSPASCSMRPTWRRRRKPSSTGRAKTVQTTPPLLCSGGRAELTGRVLGWIDCATEF